MLLSLYCLLLELKIIIVDPIIRTGARDVWYLLHRSTRAHARGLRSINAMHPELP